MSTLRDDIEQVIVDHFDPSIMGRAQAVDDILATIKKHDEALAMRSMPVSQPLTPQSVGANVTFYVDPPTPPAFIEERVRETVRAQRSGRSRSW